MKKCFKCETVKPLSEFYAHPRMADGHLNKCKDCSKNDTKKHIEKMMLNPEWVEMETERQRIKERQRRESGRAFIQTQEHRREAQRRSRSKYPEKNTANRKLLRAVASGEVLKQPCARCGSWDSEAHHEDYSKPLAVIWFCTEHHAQRHIEIRRQKRAQLAEQKKITILDLED